MRLGLRYGLRVCLLLALGSCTRTALPDYNSQSEALTVCAPNGTLPGVDVSDDQDTINWPKVAGAGIKWGYAKATESTDFKAGTFPANWSGMKANGIVRGAYHFFHPDVDGTAQADWYLAYVGGIEAGDLPPMLDWEVTDGASGATAAANAQAFINEIQAKTGRPTVIYTSPGEWGGFGAGNFGGNPLWVADWLYCDTSGCCPSMPSGWGNWSFWQWSDKGSVAGIPATVDLDVFNGSLAQLTSLAGSSGTSSSSGNTCDNAIGHPVGDGKAIACSGGSGAPTLPTAPSSCGSMPDGDGLGPGDNVTSCDGRFNLVMQTDGNVVLYAHGIALWSTGTSGKGGYLFVMQSDGNLVLYANTGCAIWASNTSGNPGAFFAVQSDGNLVVYTSAGKALWSSGSGPIPPAPSGCGALAPGQGLGPGDSVEACGGCYTLVMQGDGNLVMYKSGGDAIWSTVTSGKGGYAFEMQGDGNAVLYSNAGCPLWASNTSGHPGASLAVQDDGNVVVYSSGAAIWASNSVACAGGCQCLPPVSISPGSASVPPLGTATFSASGGTGTGFSWSLSTNASGGSLSGGSYTAGPTPNVTDTIQVVDSFGHSATATVSVGPGISTAPSAPSTAPLGSISFSASGGSGTGYVWTLTAVPSGGAISSAGAYVAGPMPNVTDVVQVLDSVGNSATTSVMVGAGVSITPSAISVSPNGAVSFLASGGSGAGYVWSMLAAPSGGVVTAAGVYTAGPTGSTQDVVQVVDSLGNSATAAVTVGVGVSISPLTAMVPPLGDVILTASGGSGTGYAWTDTTSPPAGAISSTGVYTAGAIGGLTDTIEVTDAVGNTAIRLVQVGPGISIAPELPQTPPRGTITFTASGGDGSGYEWTLAMAPSGGSITSEGVYTAGSVGKVIDVVKVVDGLGNTAQLGISVEAGVSITPASTTTSIEGTVTFSAKGGSGAGYTWSLMTSASGGMISSIGVYSSGRIGGVTDVVQVADSLGNTATADVKVTAGGVVRTTGCGCAGGASADAVALAAMLLARTLLSRRRRPIVIR